VKCVISQFISSVLIRHCLRSHKTIGSAVSALSVFCAINILGKLVLRKKDIGLKINRDFVRVAMILTMLREISVCSVIRYMRMILTRVL